PRPFGRGSANTNRRPGWAACLVMRRLVGGTGTGARTPKKRQSSVRYSRGDTPSRPGASACRRRSGRGAVHLRRAARELDQLARLNPVSHGRPVVLDKLDVKTFRAQFRAVVQND